MPQTYLPCLPVPALPGSVTTERPACPEAPAFFFSWSFAQAAQCPARLPPCGKYHLPAPESQPVHLSPNAPLPACHQNGVGECPQAQPEAESNGVERERELEGRNGSPPRRECPGQGGEAPRPAASPPTVTARHKSPLTTTTTVKSLVGVPAQVGRIFPPHRTLGSRRAGEVCFPS